MEKKFEIFARSKSLWRFDDAPKMKSWRRPCPEPIRNSQDKAQQ